MNLEAMFFPSANINHQFDEMVMGCTELINTYTVESNFDELRVKRSLIKNKGTVRADLHSKGGMFQFEFYNASFPLEFKIEFKADGNAFKVVYEIDQSNPQGHLTLFAESSSSLLVKQVKNLLKRVTDHATSKNADESNTPNISNDLESVISESQKLKEIPSDKFTSDPALVQEQKLKCNCPINQDEINDKGLNQIEHFSDKVTRQFHAGDSEQVTIYECRHCGKFIMIECETERSGKAVTKARLLDSKTATYLISIQDQLAGLIDERGAGVVNEIISGASL